MKISFNDLPDGFEVRNGEVVEVKQSGGMTTGDQSGYGLTTTNSSNEANGDDNIDVRYSLSSVPRDEANIEAEGGETVLTDLNGDGMFGLYDIKGPRHSSGGVPMYLPPQSFVYSDFNQMKLDKDQIGELGIETKKKMTPAKVSKKFGLNEYYGKMKDPYADQIQINSADLMRKKNSMKLSQLAFMQEAKKEFEDGVPVSSYPFLVKQGIDPLEFTQQVEKISEQKAQQKLIESLPYEQQMQLAELQQYMQQVDEQQMQQEPGQEQQMQQMQEMPPEMQQDMSQQGMMPPPPEMDNQQLAQMGFEIEDEYDTYSMPIAQAGAEIGDDYRDKVIDYELLHGAEDGTGLPLDVAFKKSVTGIDFTGDEETDRQLVKDWIQTIDDKYSEYPLELRKRMVDFEINSEDPRAALMEAAGLLSPQQKLQLYTNGKLDLAKLEDRWEMAEDDVLSKMSNSDFIDKFDAAKHRSYKNTRGADVSYNATHGPRVDLWRKGFKYENWKPGSFFKYDKDNNQFLKSNKATKKEAEEFLNDPEAELKTTTPQNENRVSNDALILDDWLSAIGINADLAGNINDLSNQDLQKISNIVNQVKSQQQIADMNVDQFKNVVVNAIQTNLPELEKQLSGISSTDDNNQLNIPEYDQLADLMMNPDSEFAKILDDTYKEYTKRAKDAGIDVKPKNQLIKDVLNYQKNNYSLKQILGADRFDENLDKSQSIGMNKNQYTQKIFNETAQQNPSYKGYDIDENTTRSNQIFLNALSDINEASDNPRFDIIAEGPNEQKETYKSTRLSKADGAYGNNFLNTFLRVKKSAQTVGKDEEIPFDFSSLPINEIPPIRTLGIIPEFKIPGPDDYRPGPSVQEEEEEEEEDPPLNIEPGQVLDAYKRSPIGFYPQDVLKAQAIADRERELFLPFQPAVTPIDFGVVLEEPTQAIAALNALSNTGMQALGAFSGAQGLSSRMSASKTPDEIARVIAGVNQRNVNTINRGEMMQAKVNMGLAAEERKRVTKLYDDTQVSLQNYMNELNFDREQYADAYGNMLTNRANTANLNKAFDHFEIRPELSGEIVFTNPAAFKKQTADDLQSKQMKFAEINDFYHKLTNQNLTPSDYMEFLGYGKSKKSSNNQTVGQQELAEYLQMLQETQNNQLPKERKGGRIKKYAVPFYRGKIGF